MNDEPLSKVLARLAVENPTYIQHPDGRREQMVVMSAELINDIKRLEDEVSYLRAACDRYRGVLHRIAGEAHRAISP